MSRSYREPWIVDGYKGSRTKQFFKNYSNRMIRRKTDEEIPDGKTYRKFLDPWSITDYKYYPKDLKWVEKARRK